MSTLLEIITKEHVSDFLESSEGSKAPEHLSNRSNDLQDKRITKLVILSQTPILVQSSPPPNQYYPGPCCPVSDSCSGPGKSNS